MRIFREAGLEGAGRARGVAIVIDVLRSFTVAAYALDRGAERCLLVAELAELRALRTSIRGSVASAEVGGLPVRGVRISNSPTMIATATLRGRTLIQRSSAGTPCALAAFASADAVFAAGLVVAAATVREVLELAPATVTLVSCGGPEGHLEDDICADHIEAALRGRSHDLGGALAGLTDTERFRAKAMGLTPGFPPTDLALAFDTDRFDFAMGARLGTEGLELSRVDTRAPLAADPARAASEKESLSRGGGSNRAG